MTCPYSDLVRECSGQCWACIFDERSDRYEDAPEEG